MYLVKVLNAGGQLTIEVKDGPIKVYQLKHRIIDPSFAPQLSPVTSFELTHVDAAGGTTVLDDEAAVAPNVNPFTAAVRVTVKPVAGACVASGPRERRGRYRGAVLTPAPRTRTHDLCSLHTHTPRSRPRLACSWRAKRSGRRSRGCRGRRGREQRYG